MDKTEPAVVETANAAIISISENNAKKPAKKKPVKKKPAKNKTVVEDQASAENAGFCVYIGPTIANVVQKGTIYQGRKAEVLSQLDAGVNEYSLIASLVVGGDTLAADLIKVKTPGNLLYVNYHKLASGKKEGK